MKVFVLLLVVGLVSCDSDNNEEGMPCAMKDLLGSGGQFISKNDLLSSSSSVNPFDQSPPPAVVSAAEAGISLDNTHASENPGASESSNFLEDDGYQFPRAPCVRHHIVRRVRPVVEDFVSDAPVLQNRVRNHDEYITRHFPIVRRYVSTVDEKRTRQVPLVKRRPKYVIDTETRHVPIVKTRVIPVVERYTQHVPVKKHYSRSVVDECQTNVPVVQRKYRPVITHRVQHVPVTEKRSRPVIHTELSSTPVRHPIIRNVFEPRVHTTLEPFRSGEYPSSGFWSTRGYPISGNPWQSCLFTFPYSGGYCYPEVNASVTPSKSCNCGC